MKILSQLDDNCRYWLDKTLTWSDERWNADFSLVQMQFDNKSATDKPPIVCSVRNSVWYATGLLMRQAKGDIDRACSIIEAMLLYQYNTPETVYHGTFKRFPEEPTPVGTPVVWRDYDPNWREFICTVFIILLKEYDTLIPDALQQKMQQSILLASQGSFERKVTAEYTNISLMSAFLLDYAGREFDNPEWVDYALSQAEEIYRLFNRYQTFNEYNSPTYYGIDFYALALWREYGSTEAYQAMGAEMEAELWRDTAQFYHADMRNICGPFDRSYGMDMTDYIAAVALWIATALPPEFAPLPDVEQAFDHAGDYFFMPMVAIVGTMPPDDVLPHLQKFQEERFLERTIEPQRTATAWLSENLMLGAEADYLNETRTDQFHPATIHWQAPDGTVAWIRSCGDDLIQATAEARKLQLSSKEGVTYVFEIRVPNPHADMIQSHQWLLPNLTVQLQRPDTPFTVEQNGKKLRVRFTSDEAIQLLCD